MQDIGKKMGVLAFIILILGLVFWALNSGDNTAMPNDILKDNKAYEAVKQEITIFSKKQWSKSGYNSLNNTINEYVNSKLISSSQEIELRSLLDSKYILLLSDAVKEFCKTGSENKDFVVLNGEVQTFVKNPKYSLNMESMVRWLKSYQEAINYCGQAAGYISQKCNRKRTADLISVIKDYQIKEHIMDNKWLQTKIQNSIDILQTHEKTHLTYESESLKYSCVCKTKFGKFKYYETACDSIQAERDKK